MQFYVNKVKIFLLALLMVWILMLPAYSQTDNKRFSLALQNVNLPDALRILGKFMRLNLVLSPAISGSVTLQLQDADAQAAFNLLLTSQALVKSAFGDVWYIAPRAEWVSSQQDAEKFQALAEATAPLLTRLWHIHYAKAEDLAHLLQDNGTSLLSARGHVRVDARTNSLCIQDNARNLTQIWALLKRLDVPLRQVLIAARLASVDHDFERELGVSFTARTAVTTTRTSGASVDTPINANHFSLAIAQLADGSYLDIALAAMENAGRGELISSPRLFTANQQTASIESGEEIPYQETSLSGGTTVTFKKAVLSLKVTPQIMPGNRVLLQLQVNQDRPSNRIVQGVPAISTRQIITSILVRNGQTLVLGGIYELNKEHDEQRIPFLSKIPLIGLLFQQHNDKISKRELLIFVTPEIIA